MSAPVTVPFATLERLAFVLARASGCLHGAANAFEKLGAPMPEMRGSEAECDQMRDQIRALLYPTSAAEFRREVFGDPNDITGCPMAAGYFLRDGAWMLIKPHHYWEQLTLTQSDPMKARAA